MKFLIWYYFSSPSTVSTMSLKKREPPKRKIMDEGRSFNEKWIDDYFLVEAHSKALCSIGMEFVHIFKT